MILTKTNTQETFEMINNLIPYPTDVSLSDFTLFSPLFWIIEDHYGVYGSTMDIEFEANFSEQGKFVLKVLDLIFEVGEIGEQNILVFPFVKKDERHGFYGSAMKIRALLGNDYYPNYNGFRFLSLIHRTTYFVLMEQEKLIAVDAAKPWSDGVDFVRTTSFDNINKKYEPFFPLRIYSEIVFQHEWIKRGKYSVRYDGEKSTALVKYLNVLLGVSNMPKFGKNKFPWIVENVSLDSATLIKEELHRAGYNVNVQMH